MACNYLLKLNYKNYYIIYKYLKYYWNIKCNIITVCSDYPRNNCYYNIYQFRDKNVN